jgi:hypothetical protein
VFSEENRRFAVNRDFIRRRSRTAFGKNTLPELPFVSVFVVFDFLFSFFVRTCCHGRDCYWGSSQDYERRGLASPCIGAASSSRVLH